MDLSEILKLYYEGPATEENERLVEEYFTDKLPDKPDLKQPKLKQKREKFQCKNKNKFYDEYMESETIKYKKKIRNLELNPEKENDDISITNQNENPVSIQQYIVNKDGKWANLRIFDYKEEITERIHKNNYVIIKGFTGCGKSTQVPQYIAADCQNRKVPYNIIITQPRRFAAKMLATRVAYELNCTVGSLVGYQIGLDRSRDSKITRILYCTTGVLLQRLTMSSYTETYTHIVLDEIHERSADLDMLFLVLKKMIYEQRINVKLILMSATCDVDLFQFYLTLPHYIKSNDSFLDITPSVIEISANLYGSGRIFRQDIFYLEDYITKLGNLKFTYGQNFDKPSDNDKRNIIQHTFNEQITFYRYCPKLNQMLHKVVHGIIYHQIELNDKAQNIKGTILIFLPGMGEILDLLNILKFSQYANKYKWKFFILHSTISLKEQTEVMKESLDGYRHIILATNIAESSLTVPNVEYVIDYCMCKTLISNRKGCNMTYLSLEWSSKSASDQRAGRTGRTNNGQVFRLLPSHFYQTFDEYDVPEFERTPLENYIMKAKLIDPKLPPKEVFAYALNPPKLEDVEKSILTLKRVGAFTVYVPNHLDPQTSEDEYEYDVEDGNLTALGYIMAMLPLDIMLGKLVSLGLVFDVTYESIVIAAAHCTSGFFLKNPYDPIHTFKSYLSWSNHSLSDSLAYLKAYRMYKTLESKFANNSQMAQKWCFQNNIEYQRLLELETLIEEIKIRLQSNLKIDIDFSSRSVYKKAEQDLILKVIISGAFYPNYFIRRYTNENFIRDYQSIMNCENTVMFTGFPSDNSITNSLYVPILKDMFNSCAKKIEFKVNGKVVFMKMNSYNNEISIENEDHPLYLEYKSHINSQAKSGFSLRNWSSFHETSVNTSVYLALASRRFNNSPITFNRMRPSIESFRKKEIFEQIQERQKNFHLANSNLVVNVSQKLRKYILPRLPKLHSATICINIRVCHVLTPHFFYVQYKHDFISKMLNNIDMLSSSLINVFNGNKNISQISILFDKNEANSLKNESNETIEIGSLVLAPLNIHRFDAISYIVEEVGLTKFTIDDYECILARAEVANITHYSHRSMVCLFYVDFGITDSLPLNKIHPLKCQYEFSSQKILREEIEVLDVEKLYNPQHIYDSLFRIPILAIRSQLTRIKPFSAIELVGNWMPQAKKFMIDFCAKNDYVFSVALQDQEVDVKFSLNELLVAKKFAEFKLETELYEYDYHHNWIGNFQQHFVWSPDYEFPSAFNEDPSDLNELQLEINQLEFEHSNDIENVSFPIHINGPFSPLEVRFTGMSLMNATKNVVVSSHSINSVALEPDYASNHSRLLVSGEINITEANSNRISLLNTTFMPNLVDFPAFMCLLFSPCVELRINKNVRAQSIGFPNEICGAICGIGFDSSTGISYDPDNDIDFFFDSSINVDDIELVNFLRYQISQFFYTKEQHINVWKSNSDDKSIFNLERNLFRRQQKCRQTLFQLLNRTRFKRSWFQTNRIRIDPNFKWNVNHSIKLDHCLPFKEFSEEMLSTINMKTAVLKPIFIPKLRKDDEPNVEWEDAVIENLEFIEADKLENCIDKETNLFLCKLCMVTKETRIEMHIHVKESSCDSHKELAHLFKQYYRLWKDELTQMKRFTTESTKEESTTVPPVDGFVNIPDNDFGSTLDCIDYQLDMINQLDQDQDSSAKLKISYNQPSAIEESNRKDMKTLMPLFNINNQNSIIALKRNLDKLIQNSQCDGFSAYECLTEFLDDDEISLIRGNIDPLLSSRRKL
ncbi:hypothetical protein RDWZM_009647 [Blomia tropicalis]|uniref:ATP-dependent RNA helicase spindle-E n=1 Tax=Blomia tropicalis TaxID=40697 RepID=A0A9Q0M3G8_BLOTA|nr:hypothetical protein RDWZM_009647 [Blomia tropicalis]